MLVGPSQPSAPVVAVAVGDADGAVGVGVAKPGGADGEAVTIGVLVGATFGDADGVIADVMAGVVEALAALGVGVTCGVLVQASKASPTNSAAGWPARAAFTTRPW